MATFPIYQFYVELDGYEPKMWRRFQVMNHIYLNRLAYIIMTLYETRNDYSYEFRKDEQEIFLRKHPEYKRNPERLKELNKSFENYDMGQLLWKMYICIEFQKAIKNYLMLQVLN